MPRRVSRARLPIGSPCPGRPVSGPEPSDSSGTGDPLVYDWVDTVPMRRQDVTCHKPSCSQLVHLLRPLSTLFPLFVVLCLSSTALAQGSSAPAQSSSPPAAETSSPASPEQLQQLIATLEDDGARARLVDQLRLMLQASKGQAEAAAPQPDNTFGSRLLGFLSRKMEHVGGELGNFDASVGDFSAGVAWFTRQLEDPAARGHWSEIVVNVLVVVAIGLAAGWVIRLLLRRPREALERRVTSSLFERFLILLARLFIAVVPLVGFAVAPNLALSLLNPSRLANIVTLAITYGVVAVGAVVLVAWVLLAPHKSHLRLFRMRDATATSLYRWTVAIAAVVIFGYFGGGVASLLGASAAARTGLLAIVSLVIAILLIALVLANRRRIADLLGGRDREEAGTVALLRHSLADAWHVLAIAYVTVIFVVSLLSDQDGFTFMVRGTVLALAVLLVAWMLTLIVQRADARRAAIAARAQAAREASVEALVAREEEAAGGDATEESRPVPEPSPPDAPTSPRRRGPSWVVRGITALIWALALVLLLVLWGVDVLGWLEGPIGRAVTQSLVSIVFVILGAMVAWRVVNGAITRHLDRIEAAGDTLEHTARVKTLLPLLRNALLIVIGTVTLLVVLSEVGVDIAPLLAGAGVVGLAIGFGSQALVRDIITGLFILLEDTIAVGDVVTVAGQGGFVTRMTIRTIQMRDLSGNLHTIPFGEVTNIMNMTREFSYYVFDIGVAYREDVDEVMDVVRALGAEMRRDPEFGPMILEPIEILGVDAFADSAVVIKARIKTRPIRQWTVGREFNRRLKKRFDSLGIEIPFPHMTLYFGQDKQGAAPPAHIDLDARHLTEVLAQAQERAGPDGEASGTARAETRPAPSSTGG